ncbi:MAG: acylphosphatase [Candidatus Magasanikbacteria bacterium]|jgi:acylphosphatase|nr:acylphosphatase [Candidatus Magasanikbacteria bacterium]MBT4314483.1 acylphosphatase [Candidatus Magasanikbacteria bacterium]MBT4547311.1 acylphosphatase [Candidatus Magasanikbacteria bacterium]MBT6818920.1 acylphosphatase [Candidatus Magasanikbacteria bacterium]
MKHLNLKIHGKVQGVFFREKTKQLAQELGLNGYVKNTSDNCVEVVVEGDELALKKLLDWCKIGTEYAEVGEVEEKWSDEVGEFEEFKIVY